MNVEIDTNAWKPLPIFDLIEKSGKIDFDEMYEVFNMGIGMTIVASAEDADAILKHCHANGTKAVAIGQAVKGEGKVTLKR